MLQLTRSGVRVSGDGRERDRLREEFDRQHCVRLTGLLDSAAIGFLRETIDRASFVHRTHAGIGVEVCMESNAALALLYFLANAPELHRLVQHITRCGRIGAFVGRVYRMVPGAGHYDSWHRDNVAHRLIGMSVNLGAENYVGGVFRLRKVGSPNVLCEAANTGCGDAILFRIADDLEHMVTPLEGGVAKTAFAGWFVSEPDFLSMLTSDAWMESQP